MKSRHVLGLTLFFSLSAFSTFAQEGQQESQEETIEGIASELGDIFQNAIIKKLNPIKRPVFGKDHGCLKGTFEIDPKLPAYLRQGVFKTPGREFPAWVRFANDGSAISRDDAQTTRGMSIKLVGVEGKKLLEGEEDALTQDFVMVNHPTFFSNTAHDFLEFNRAGQAGAEAYKKYLEDHPETQSTFDDMDKNVMVDPLYGTYWTPTPYKFGETVMKYKVEPVACTDSPAGTYAELATSGDSATSPNFLRENLKAHIASQDACFEFSAQFRFNARHTPYDKATVRWDTPFFKLAKLTLPKGQNVDDENRVKTCERMSFTGWHAVPAHRPVGSLNAVRKYVYKRMADHRADHNGPGYSHQEPTEIKAEE